LKNFVVYNNSEGCFSLSPEAVQWLSDRGVEKAWKLINDLDCTIHILNIDEAMLGLERHSPLLVLCVQEMGAEASGDLSMLEIAEINEDRYLIRNINGFETVLTPSAMEWTKIL
tara:strand:+ start:193 stop:534 length:342 start_codon:yes stop_codon:yes gene_type:complete